MCMIPACAGMTTFVVRPHPHKKCYCECLALSLISISMIVCICNAIREGEVRAAARDGAASPTSAYRARGCKPRCGQCLPFAREIIAQERGGA